MSAPDPGADVDWEALRAAAESARDRAYAPYSNYAVGAALLDAAGTIHLGANMENASYGLCLCAERAALSRGMIAGARPFRALFVLTGGEVAGSPCGMCRQVMLEVLERPDDDLPVRCESTSGARLDTSARALLPHGFDGSALP